MRLFDAKVAGETPHRIAAVAAGQVYPQSLLAQRRDCLARIQAFALGHREARLPAPIIAEPARAVVDAADREPGPAQTPGVPADHDFQPLSGARAPAAGAGPPPTLNPENGRV